MSAIDLLALDRTLQRAAFERERSERDCAGEASPLEHHRTVSGLRALEALDAAQPSLLDAPLASALRPWIAELLGARLAYPALAALARARREPIVLPPVAAIARGAGEKRVTWREAWHALLAQPASGAAAWLDALAASGPEMAGVLREVRGRLGEVHDRVRQKLEGGGGDPLWKKLGLPLANEAADALADAILAATDDVARDVLKDAARREGGSTPAHAIVDALAREATPSFPARVRPRWLEDLFATHTHGLRVAPELAPDVYGGASFVRALGAFGFALRRAVEPVATPFALRRAPANVDAERFAAVFAVLPASLPFARHVLGSTPVRAREDRRALARTVLFETRLRAARVLLRESSERFEDISQRVFGRPLPRGLEGAWPSVDVRASARLVGVATAPALARDLVDRFDEDWFRNPRAFQWLRARGSLPLAETEGEPIATDAVAPVAKVLARALQEMFV